MEDSSDMRKREFRNGEIKVYNEDVLNLYDEWDSPVVIVSDGAYGTGNFPGDPEKPEEIADWYRPHIKKWSENATPQTTLWFWNTEIGWATVHPILKEYGWEYRGCNIWNKGIQHVAGNSNTKKLRKFPQVTEVCVHYVKKPEIEADGRKMSLKEWLRHEWKRAGLTLDEANKACGVANAASRKYLTQGDLWYFPPPEAFGKMSEYANEHGDEEGKPYFALDGEEPLDADDWEKMRAKFDLDAGITNVWDEPPLNGDERIKEKGNGKAKHLNQKPLKLMKRIIKTSSDKGDIVWDPFGGIFTGALACKKLDRECRTAEIVDDFYELGIQRLKTGGGAKGDSAQSRMDNFDQD